MSTKIKVAHRLRNLLRGRGLEVMRFHPNTTPSILGWHLARLFPRLQIDCVLDVGARLGEYGTWLRANGYTGRIVSFEPVAENFDQLRQAAAGDPKWTVHRFALGSEGGRRDINVTGGTNFSSFLEPTAYASSEFGQRVSVSRRESVEIRRLDDLWDEAVEMDGKPRVYLKMDTQGWDIEVLKGAASSLPSVLALQSEISVQAIYQGIPSHASSIEYLTQLGFELSGLFPVSLDRCMRVIDFDCVAVRASAFSTGQSG